MNNARQEAGAPGGGPNCEDLDIVLGRFQTWAETRRTTPRETHDLNSGPVRVPLSASVKLPSAARELSYEEALRASKYRRPAELESIGPVSPARDENPAAATETQEDAARRGFGWRGVALPHSGPWRETLWAQTVRALAPDPSTVKAASMVTERPLRPPTIDAETGHAIDADLLPNAAATAVKAATPPPEAISNAVSPSRPPIASQAPLDSACAAEPVPKPRRSRQPESAQPAFRDVLKGTAALVAAAQPGGVALSRGKSTSFTVRVSDAEQARIQACAAQANLSVSAYLRQCALGVDGLREQVQVALSNLQEQQTRAMPRPGISAIPGILGRFAMGCVRRLRNTPEDYTVVSIR